MRLDEYLKNETTEIEHCQQRHHCPMGHLCGTGNIDEPNRKLFPTILEIDKGDRFWTDMRFEQRVFVVKSGVFVCLSNDSEGKEIPIAIYGPNTAIGLAEIFAPREISGMYHLCCLSPGSACSFSTNAVRKAMETLSSSCQSAIIGCNLVNQTAALTSQLKILSRQSYSDRILLLLLRLYNTNGSQPSKRNLKITHGEIATLIGSDRVTATRALHKARDEGYIELGYSSIIITDKLLAQKHLVEDALVHLYFIDDGNEDCNQNPRRQKRPAKRSRQIPI